MSVDMAKMKSEFLSHYYKKFSMSIKDKVISNMPKLIWLLKISNPIVNFLNKVLLSTKSLNGLVFHQKDLYRLLKIKVHLEKFIILSRI